MLISCPCLNYTQHTDLIAQSALRARLTQIKVQAPNGEGKKLSPCSPGDRGAREMTWMDVDAELLLLADLSLKDFIKAVKGARPTVNAADNEKVFPNRFSLKISC